ncbi:MAG: carbohydrate ABC transporter permease [Rhodoblastus sp.]
MSYQNKSSSRIYPVITYLVLFGVFILVVSPLQWAIASSFSQNDLIFRNVFPFSWKAFVPSQFTMEAYQALFTQRDFGLVLRNTFILSIGTVLLSGLINLLAGFAFATFDFNGKNLLFGLVLFTFMVPIEVTIIPQYLQMKNLGWINTWQGLFIPGLANSMVIFLFRQILFRDSKRSAGCSQSRWRFLAENSLFDCRSYFQTSPNRCRHGSFHIHMELIFLATGSCSKP